VPKRLSATWSIHPGAGTGGTVDAEDYPIPRAFCGARTRTGGLCRQPSMANGRCRLHDGRSKAGKEHGRYRHGFYTREARARRKALRDLLKEVQAALPDE
jgi:hypothetical protein